MNWNVVKLAMLNGLLNWLVGRVWMIAQDTVALLQQRDDLSGDQKLALARANLISEAKDLGIELANSAANFLVECALQYLRGRAGK